MTSQSSNGPYTAKVAITQVGYSSFAECTACRFFEPNQYADHGVCHRYPSATVVHCDYWCGEWKSINPNFETK
jgi:hypothetical protein